MELGFYAKACPECVDCKWDCFANVSGRCRILSNTNFKHECPFYKTREEYEEGLRKYPYVKPEGGK